MEQIKIELIKLMNDAENEDVLLATLINDVVRYIDNKS